MITYLIHAKDKDLQIPCKEFEIKGELLYYWITNNTQCGIIHLADVYYVEIVEAVCTKCSGNGVITEPRSREPFLINCPECGGTGKENKI